MKKRSLINVSLFLFLSIALLSSHSFIYAEDAKPFLGTWNGAISAMGMEIEITVKFALDETKAVKGTIDVPQEPGAVDVPLGDIKIEGKRILDSRCQHNRRIRTAMSNELCKCGHSRGSTVFFQ